MFFLKQLNTWPLLSLPIVPSLMLLHYDNEQKKLIQYNQMLSLRLAISVCVCVAWSAYMKDTTTIFCVYST